MQNTGRENTYFNGVILGMTRKEIDKKFQAIVDFVGLWDFIDQPVKHYSSGMYPIGVFCRSAQIRNITG